MSHRFHRIAFLCLLIVGIGFAYADTPADKPDARLAYPPTKVEPVTDELHGVKLTDPYRWLEDDASPEVQAWVEKQIAFTKAWFDRVPQRNSIRPQIEKLLRVTSTGAPTAYKQRYFFTKRDPEQNHAVLYVRTGGYDAPPKMVIDPNTFSPDGTVALDWYYPSADGSVVAYGKSASGSENSTLYLIDVQTGKHLDVEIPGTRFCSIAWEPDGSGFYYTRYPLPGEVPPGDEHYYSHVFQHRLGRAWKQDSKIWGEGEPKEKRAYVYASSDQRRVFMGTSLDWARNDLFVRPFGEYDVAFQPVAVGLDARTNGDYLGDRLMLLTNYRAPRYRVVEADPSDPNPEKWKEIIPQQRGVIQSMSIIDGKIILTILEDVCSRIVILDSSGKQLREVSLPTLGAAGGVNGNLDGTEFFFSFSSFAWPPTNYRYDLRENKLHELERMEIDIDPKRYETRQVWYTSKDGTRIPMFVVHKKGLKLDGTHPTLLYGYGGFNISMTPRFRNTLFAWLDKGGVYAVANIRGGGEFGSDWHHAGRLEKKQNCFDDFIAAGRYLCEQKFTSPARLAAMGGSNGGLLMGAMITQAPELFRAIVCAVPLLDMIRFHQFSMARFWIQEYGSSEDPEQFKYILKYSPYQNVRKGVRYPAVLITTGDSDGRVDPCHARKMAALLQAETGADHPILLRYETKAGHGAGKPISKIIDAQADEWAFLMKELGME